MIARVATKLLFFACVSGHQSQSKRPQFELSGEDRHRTTPAAVIKTGFIVFQKEA